jgi:hypothetical protein
MRVFTMLEGAATPSLAALRSACALCMSTPRCGKSLFTTLPFNKKKLRELAPLRLALERHRTELP